MSFTSWIEFGLEDSGIPVGPGRSRHFSLGGDGAPPSSRSTTRLAIDWRVAPSPPLRVGLTLVASPRPNAAICPHSLVAKEKQSGLPYLREVVSKRGAMCLSN